MEMDGALMGFEQEAVSELYASVWGDRSTMQREFTVEPMVSSSCPGAVHEGDANAIAIGVGAAGQFRPHLHCAVVSGEKGWVTRDIDSRIGALFA